MNLVSFSSSPDCFLLRFVFLVSFLCFGGIFLIYVSYQKLVYGYGKEKADYVLELFFNNDIETVADLLFYLGRYYRTGRSCYGFSV